MPVAYSAITASVIAASGMWLQSSVIGCNGQVPRETSSQFSPGRTFGAHRLRGVDEAAMSPWIESLPTPSMRTGAS